MLAQLTQQDEQGVQPAALGCGSVRYFDMSALRMMGMRQGRFDFHANLHRVAQDQLNLELLGYMYGWAEVAVDMSLQADNASPQALSQQSQSCGVWLSVTRIWATISVKTSSAPCSPV
ncbi:hypothetical protein LH51_05490 [Nitrincola sp. A-D6]|uniref:hypothetical protein n=1 Tax=Nitrincola sp. A-D6 TaxID=1545442 RepID=UPI00051FE6D3|nr:hypothetical protein [Nitrincola sp. A-D6]KGK42647.1 hypothetical protein LH51_05490 [Nitrincola sp. A-D6]